MKMLLLYGLVYIFIFSVLKKVRWEGNIFRLPANTGFFYTLVSMLTSNTSLSFFGMVSVMTLMQGEVGIWFLLAPSLSAGLHIYIFGPLWAQCNWDNENQLLLERYRGRWARILHHFRGVYVGLVVNAILISGMLISFADMVSAFTSVSRQEALYFSCIFLLVNLWRTTLSSKILSDVYNTGMWITVILIGFFAAVFVDADISTLPAESATTYGAFPYTETAYFRHFLLYVGIQWWSAQMFDGSGLNAQRLMNFSPARIRWLLWVYQSIMVLIIIMVSKMVMVAAPLVTSGKLQEQAFFLYVNSVLPASVSLVIPLVIFGVFAGSVESQLNWAGSLMHSVPTGRWLKDRWKPYVMMLLILATAILCTIYFDRIHRVAFMFLGISAGVSLVYALRWFTPRINAQVQLSAMLGGVVYTMLVKALLARFFPAIEDIDGQIYLMVAVTILVGITAIIVSLLTYTDEDRQAYEHFRGHYRWPARMGLTVVKSLLYGWALVMGGYLLFTLMVR